MNKCEECIHYKLCSEYYYVGDLCGEFEDASRFVELPCSIGDIVWTDPRPWRKEDGITPYQITNLTITQNKKGVWTKKYRAMWLVDGKTRDSAVNFSFDEIGNTVFLTEEEAQKKLEEV